MIINFFLFIRTLSSSIPIVSLDTFLAGRVMSPLFHMKDLNNCTALSLSWR